MRRLLFFVTLTSILTGCVSGLATRSFSPVATSSQTVSLPLLDIPSEAEVGQSMISTAKRSVIPAIQLDQDVSHSGINLGYNFTVTIQQGVLPLRATDLGGKFYQAKDDLKFVVGGGVHKVKGGVFVPNDNIKPTEIFWIAPDILRPLNDVHPEINFKPAVFEQWDADSFKRELVYSGVSQNTISILYREFQNDMARPAFSQELKYDLSQGTAIGYKGARFEVIKANNTGITYKVLKAME